MKGIDMLLELPYTARKVSAGHGAAPTSSVIKKHSRCSGLHLPSELLCCIAAGDVAVTIIIRYQKGQACQQPLEG